MQKMTSVLTLAAVAALTLTRSVLAGSPGEGGGEPQVKLKAVQVADLPAAVRKALDERALVGAIQRVNASPVYYMVELTWEGKKMAVWVNQSGTALEGPGPVPGDAKEKLGAALAWSDLPEAVQNLVSTKFQGAPLGEIRKSQVIYTIHLLHGEEVVPLRVTERGQVLPMRHGEGTAPDAEEMQLRAQQEEEQAFLKGQRRHERPEERATGAPRRHSRESPE